MGRPNTVSGERERSEERRLAMNEEGLLRYLSADDFRECLVTLNRRTLPFITLVHPVPSRSESDVGTEMVLSPSEDTSAYFEFLRSLRWSSSASESM